MQLFEEEILEPIARYFRFKKGIAQITKNKPIDLLDLGCGPKISFYHFASKRGVKIKKYIGIDPLLQRNTLNQMKSGITLLKHSLLSRIPLGPATADYAVGFAVLEHFDEPEKILVESIRVLKKGGKSIFTVPSYKAKTLLEFLSFRLALISKREIAEHKHYFDKRDLTRIVQKDKKISISHQYFEFGLNNLLVITKH